MGHHSCCNKEYVRKGLWSPEEDLKLINHIRTNGHGCWNSVPKLAGLERCGKSCRLRWINYLRPDLKKGAFTTEEALLVIKLQQVVGNRWAQIAKHLPGRTGNKVKNFWNSSIKRKLVALQDQLTVDANIAVALKDQANFNGSVILGPNFQKDQTIPIEPQMDHPMVIVPNVQVGHSLMNQNAQMIDHPNIVPNSQIPIPQPPPPPEPSIVIQGFDGPIETIYDPKMMSYNPNMAPIPPSVIVPSHDFDDLPSWPPSPYNSLDHQNQFINQDIVLENYHMNSNPEMMQAYSQDSIMLNAAVPEMRPQTVYGAYDGVPLPLLHKENSLARPLAPIHVPLHPNHINNVESLLTSFTSSTQYSTAFPNFASTFASNSTAAMPCAGLQCNGYFLGNPNGSSA